MKTDLVQQAEGWLMHPTAIVDEGAEIGPETRVWHWTHICAGASIGSSCSLGQGVFIGNKVIIGDNVKIQNNVSVYDNVTLENDVFCGPSCVFTNVINPRSEIARKDEYMPTLVKQGATLGANATLICGNTLGQYCFIAAGAVVTSRVANFSLMAGVPARRIGWMSRAGYRLDSHLKCPETNTQYVLENPETLIEVG